MLPLARMYIPWCNFCAGQIKGSAQTFWTDLHLIMRIIVAMVHVLESNLGGIGVLKVFLLCRLSYDPS